MIGCRCRAHLVERRGGTSSWSTWGGCAQASSGLPPSRREAAVRGSGVRAGVAVLLDGEALGSRAEELVVAQVVVHPPLQPGDHGLGHRGVGDLREEVAGVVE